jgi:hypothetical protein
MKGFTGVEPLTSYRFPRFRLTPVGADLWVGIRIAFLGLQCASPVEGVDRVPVSHFRGGRHLKAFLAALAVGAFALIAGRIGGVIRAVA